MYITTIVCLVYSLLYTTQYIIHKSIHTFSLAYACLQYTGSLSLYTHPKKNREIFYFMTYIIWWKCISEIAIVLPHIICMYSVCVCVCILYIYIIMYKCTRLSHTLLLLKEHQNVYILKQNWNILELIVLSLLYYGLRYNSSYTPSLVDCFFNKTICLCV